MIRDLATGFRALADPTRLLLAGVLLGEELTVGELAEVADMAQPGVSRHLAALRDAGLVVSRRQGTMTFYRANAQESLLQGAVRETLEQAAREPAVAARVQRALERRRARVRAFFEREAAGWDELRAQLLNDSAAMAALLPLVPRGLRVVDIGTGTGGMLPQLAVVADHILAVDHSPQMLRRARERARRLGLRNVEFRRADAARLPAEANAFDAAFAVLVLHHAPRPARLLAEMARVVRPGGHVVVIDLVAHGEEWLRKEQADLWLGFSLDEIAALLRHARLVDERATVVSKAVSPRGTASLELFVASAAKKPA
jgi:ArsR family transcriptional regulator